MPEYGNANYWEHRYIREPSAFDWYQTYHGLQHIIHNNLSQEGKLLQVGVGTSRIQEHMVKSGFKSIMNIDFSKAAISHLSEFHKGVQELEFKVADMRDLSCFEDESFAGVLDKGALDAVMCGEGAVPDSLAVIRAVDRVLRPGGTFLMVTYSGPDTRLSILSKNSLEWTISVYIITKGDRPDPPSGTVPSASGPAVVKGPYDATNQDAMAALSKLDDVHFAYVCKKAERPPDPESD